MLGSVLLIGLALVISLAAMPVVIRILKGSKIFDIPNARSSHAMPVPRGGGFGLLLPLALVGGLLASSGRLGDDPFVLAIAIGMVGMTLIGFLDDLFSLSAQVRLLLEGILMASCLAIAPFHVHEIALPLVPPIETSGVVGWLLAWLFMVGFPNLFNFMDGIDGLAGSQALIASIAYLLLAQASGAPELALLAALLAGGSLGFLRFNVPRAQVFMGDSGSLPVGFFLAATALALASEPGGLPLPVPVLVLWVFLFDAGLTLVIRAARGRRLHHAHRQHLYQRLVASGFTHVRVTAMYALAMIGAAVAAWSYLHAGDTWRLVILVVVAATSCALALTVLQRYRSRVVWDASRCEQDD